jgi:hypothetical protein
MAFLTALRSKPSPHIIPPVKSVPADLSVLMLKRYLQIEFSSFFHLADTVEAAEAFREV